MRIAILSDIHDNIWTLRSALDAVQDAEALICCGDLCSPFIIPILGGNFSKPIYLVFGNNDGDRYRITRNASRFPHIHIEAELMLIEIAGKKFAINHFNDLGLEIARNQIHDVVCFGHNHRYQVERFGNTLAINPGTLMGYSPLDQRDVPPTFVIYDSALHQVNGYQVMYPEPCRGALLVQPFSGS
jgi:hypothetical protein